MRAAKSSSLINAKERNSRNSSDFNVRALIVINFNREG